MGSMDKLFAQGMMGGGQPAPGDDKPAVVFTAPGLLLGANFGQSAKGVDNLNSAGLFGKDLMKAPQEGGQAIVSWSSKPKEGNWAQKILAQAGDNYLSSFKNGSQASGGSSGGGGGGGDSGAAASSGSSAPVSSGGGGGSGSSASSGGGGGSSTASRGGSEDAGLSRAIASLQGISFNPEQISAPVHHEISAPVAPPPPVVAQVALADDGVGIG